MEPDFSNLSAVWKTLKPTGVKAKDYNPTNKPVSCPAYTAGFWEVDPKAALPTLGEVHDFNAQSTTKTMSGGSVSATGAKATSKGGSGKVTGTGSAAQATSTSSTGAAAEGLGRELQGIGAVFAGAMAVLAWL